MPVLIERRGKHVLQRLWIGDLLQPVHALVVFEPVFLHPDHRGVARLPLLRAQHLLGVFECGLDHGNHVKRVHVGFRVEQFQRGEQERAERLVEREIVGHVHVEEVVEPTVVALFGLDHLRVEQGLEYLVGTFMQMLLLVRRLRGVVDQLVDAPARVTALRDLVEHHRMSDLHVRDECFRRGVNQLVKRALVPRDEPFRRLLALDFLEFLRIVPGLGDGLGVFDLVFGRLGDDQSLRVEAHAAGAAGDLMELAGAQATHLGAVELRQRGQHDRMDRHVDADSQRIGAADDRQQPLLRKLLDETTISRQHAGMVDADAGTQQPLQYLAERGRELHTLDGLGDGLSLLLAGHARAGQRVGGLQRGILREMHHVNRRLALAERQFHRLLQRVECVFVRQRYGTWRIGDDIHVGVRHVLKLVGDCVDIAQRRAHQ